MNIILTMVLLILIVNVIMAIINYYHPFLDDEDDKTFETITLLFIGSLILGGVIIGWFLRLFIKEDDDTVIRKRK